MRQLVIGDIHGAYKALIQVLERANFDPDVDQLIFLGDAVDGYAYTTECIEYLSMLPNLIQIMGNHDDWCYRWLGERLGRTQFGLDSSEYRCWVSQGGRATLDSMKKHDSYELVYNFLSKSKPYHVDNYKLFVHGGVEARMKAEDCHPESLMWNRTLIMLARQNAISTEPTVTEYDECYIGHTPIINYNKFEPTQWSNVIACDCGASYPRHGGRLGIIDVDTKQTWTSDPTSEIYPNERAR